MKNYILYFIFFIMTGCVSTNFSASSLPNWYLNAPNNNKETLYGVGDGSSIKEAKANAIDDMASRLSVQINSTYYKKVTSSSDNYDKLITKEINLNIQNFTFNNAKVLNSSQSGGKIYILMAVDRKEVFDKVFSKFMQTHKAIESKFSYNQNLSNYEKLKNFSSLKKEIEQASLKVDILKAINPNFSEQQYINLYENILNSIYQIKQDLTFAINYDTQNQPYALALSSLIAKRGYKVDNSSNVKIETLVEGANSVANGFQVYRDRITITLKVNNKALSSQVIEAKGVSQNPTNARNKAVNDFSLKVDIDKLLFGE